MDALEKLVNLHENTLVPLLKTFGEDLKSLTKDTQAIRLGQEKHQGRIQGLEEKMGALKCETNTAILQGYGARLAKLEGAREAAHQQDRECREKNKQVDEALRLARKNKKKNEEQEARHKEMLSEQKEKSQKIINRIWLLLVTVTGVALAPWFTKLWGIATKGGP